MLGGVNWKKTLPKKNLLPEKRYHQEALNKPTVVLDWPSSKPTASVQYASPKHLLTHSARPASKPIRTYLSYTFKVKVPAGPPDKTFIKMGCRLVRGGGRWTGPEIYPNLNDLYSRRASSCPVRSISCLGCEWFRTFTIVWRFWFTSWLGRRFSYICSNR